MARILVVDDDPNIVQLYGNVAVSMGHTPVHCCSGVEAWELLCSGEHIDLMIVDIIMPDMDGRELVHRVQQEEKLAHIAIIIISGLTNIKDIAHLLEAGAACFLPKPVNIDEMKLFIDKNVPPAEKPIH